MSAGDGPDRELVALVAESCRSLGRLDLTHGALGHVSYRPPGSETMIIKGKGPREASLRDTEPHDAIEVDFNANKVVGADGLQPPNESFLHLSLFQRDPDLRCVIHVHPHYATRTGAVVASTAWWGPSPWLPS